MLRVRAVGSSAEFVGAPGDPDGYETEVTELWQSGASRPQWCFLLEDDGERVGRIGYRVDDTVPDPAFLGSLPPYEMFAFGLHLPWEAEPGVLMRVLLDGSLPVVDAPPLFTHLTVHNEFHTHPEERVAALEAAGCALFQEKHGYVWVDDGQTVGVPDRLEFRTLEEVGDEAYGAVMGPTQEGTLDRNDVYYWGGTGPDAWAGVFLSIAGDDRCSWLAGFAGDEPVGFMAISAFHEPGAGTIAHCGVLPEHRGNGYMGDLLAAGTAVARERGFSSIVSDVDVVNHPMIAAMLRAGHRDDVRPWHTWVFRKHR